MKNTTTQRKTPAQMYQQKLSKIENIFLQVPVTLDGTPIHTAENNGKSACPRWCDVAVEMQTLVQLKTTKKNAATTKKRATLKVVVATPILMPLKRSGKCLVPPFEKCTFDVSEDSFNDTAFGSCGRVVRLYLSKDTVDQIKTKLLDYIDYKSEKEEEESSGGLVEGGDTRNAQIQSPSQLSNSVKKTHSFRLERR